MQTSQLITLPNDSHTHNHEHHQLVLGLQGQTIFDIAGLGQDISAGAGCIVPSTTNHAFCGLGDNQILVLNLTTQQHRTLDEHELINHLFQRANYFQIDQRLQTLAYALSLEMRQYPEDRLLAQSCSNTLLHSLKHYIDLPQASSGRIDQTLIDLYIQQHLSHKIQVHHLSGLCFLSPSQFHSCFKQQFGTTPHQYVLEKRLLAAQTYLKQGKIINQVIELCGFSNQSAFTHAFKKRFGVTPARYLSHTA